jgi:hypothetical protein
MKNRNPSSAEKQSYRVIRKDFNFRGVLLGTINPRANIARIGIKTRIIRSGYVKIENR